MWAWPPSLKLRRYFRGRVVHFLNVLFKIVCCSSLRNCKFLLWVDSQGEEIVRCDRLVERRPFTSVRDVGRNWNIEELCLNCSGLDNKAKGLSSLENNWAKSMKPSARRFWKNILLKKEDDKMKKQTCMLRSVLQMSGERSGLWDLWFVYVIFCLI